MIKASLALSGEKGNHTPKRRYLDLDTSSPPARAHLRRNLPSEAAQRPPRAAPPPTTLWQLQTLL